MMHSVSEERRGKVQSFLKPEDANRGLLGEILIRSIISVKLNMANKEIHFTAEPYGKPSVAGLPSFHFNIAHSGRWIVCAVDSDPVGIDIEEIKPINLDVASYFFSMQEYRWLMGQNETSRLPCFYELWTLKESFVKWLGKGLSFPLQSFSIVPGADHSLSWPAAAQTCFFNQPDADPDYKMAVCSTTVACPKPMIVKSIDDLFFYSLQGSQV
ncbi:4'-phosphopantetheinyl transferase superfamily protein [Paenibacillus piri]|uniref:4'-phosphopantetheinyl transferase superfamily protein n=2 Tax=Paenibacillus piri TaxID=2547395 RepID=A0A4R5KE38_9BACL|nr:4'-phosphopantetheinyl transferase superfamily protein [Paenibacillus piri]